ncbi:CBS domain-containing protein [Rhodococcus spongiicola]|uniref:CBS domain-containing protein n=1 Tax=Rhodococcus spongiicola TaxID=2487352 RepID=UPI000FDD9FA9|nr:CBS domain-containing protein [Rhodococcus spongiicola]
MRAGDIMTTRVVTIDEHATLAYAAHLLGPDPESALHVVDASGRLVGIVTATHLLDRIRALLNTIDLASTGWDSVSDTMTSPVLAVGADTDITHIVAALTDRDARTCTVPVVDGFTPIGAVTRLDLVRALSEGTPPPPPKRSA